MTDRLTRLVWAAVAFFVAAEMLFVLTGLVALVRRGIAHVG